MPDMNGTNPGDPLQRGQYTNPINGQPSSVPGSPGFSGAIMDLLASLAKSFAPRGIVQHPQAVQQAIGAQEQGNAAPPTLGSQIGQ